MTNIPLIKKGKYSDAAYLSLNRIRYRANEVSNVVKAQDPTYLEVSRLFEDFFQALEDYGSNH